ncbi:lipopolysaccharide biosynthesis protein [Rhodococcus sp. IEGM 1379]|uniref:lipopolysaccharide biosynthesis protein n=1 Tax=Rhodococcus sp. IEGM 1379 TaxID=3047086 RepID=UPI0024B71E82|nr:lipopolysaccharide biosynthesis protein [Rhodococcus sp. IEGM 1379]MDI9915077.1 lipopolysaccharide biosynthesis protein [Rhodococcus sp. IEGM 1379]
MIAVDAKDSALGRTAVRGASATMLGQMVRIVVLLASTVILARVLAPRDFGLMAIIASVVALGELFRDFGLSTAASREEHLTRGQQSNLFWINTALGAALTGIALLVAPVLASIFGEPLLVPIMQSISIVFVLGGVSTQFRAELARRLRFGALAVVDTVPIVVGLIAALLYAAWERTFWVLVIQQLATAIAGLILAVALARWRPGLPDRSASIRQLMSFGIGLFGTQSVAYVTKNADNMAIGIVWGAEPLGIYSRAYQLLMMPINQISAPLTRVAVPVLTRVADDTARYLRYLQSGQLLGGVVLGLAYGILAGLADPMVHVVFGANWAAMVPVFQVLAIGGIFRALNQITFWMFLAKGKSIAQFKFYLVTQPLIVAAMLSGLPWGPTGVAVGHTVGYFVHWIVSYWWCGKVTETPVRELFIAGGKQVGLFAAPALIIGLAANFFIPSGVVSILVGVCFLGIYLILLRTCTAYGREVFRTLITCAKMARR